MSYLSLHKKAEKTPKVTPMKNTIKVLESERVAENGRFRSRTVKKVVDNSKDAREDILYTDFSLDNLIETGAIDKMAFCQLGKDNVDGIANYVENLANSVSNE